MTTSATCTAASQASPHPSAWTTASLPVVQDAAAGSLTLPTGGPLQLLASTSLAAPPVAQVAPIAELTPPVVPHAVCQQLASNQSVIEEACQSIALILDKEHGNLQKKRAALDDERDKVCKILKKVNGYAMPGQLTALM